MRNLEKSTRSGFVLTDQLALEIYKCKLDLLTPRTFKSSLENRNSRTRGQSPLVGKAFGVSAKTIRDIWNRRTWATATSCLWELERCTDPSDDWRRSANQSLHPSSQESICCLKLAVLTLTLLCYSQVTSIDAKSFPQYAAMPKTKDNVEMMESFSGLQFKTAQTSLPNEPVFIHVLYALQDRSPPVTPLIAAPPSSPRRDPWLPDTAQSCCHVAFHDPFHDDWPHW